MTVNPYNTIPEELAPQDVPAAPKRQPTISRVLLFFVLCWSMATALATLVADNGIEQAMLADTGFAKCHQPFVAVAVLFHVLSLIWVWRRFRHGHWLPIVVVFMMLLEVTLVGALGAANPDRFAEATVASRAERGLTTRPELVELNSKPINILMMTCGFAVPLAAFIIFLVWRIARVPKPQAVAEPIERSESSGRSLRKPLTLGALVCAVLAYFLEDLFKAFVVQPMFYYAPMLSFSIIVGSLFLLCCRTRSWKDFLLFGGLAVFFGYSLLNIAANSSYQASQRKSPRRDRPPIVIGEMDRSSRRTP